MTEMNEHEKKAIELGVQSLALWHAMLEFDRQAQRLGTAIATEAEASRQDELTELRLWCLTERQARRDEFETLNREYVEHCKDEGKEVADGK